MRVRLIYRMRIIEKSGNPDQFYLFPGVTYIPANMVLAHKPTSDYNEPRYTGSAHGYIQYVHTSS